MPDESNKRPDLASLRIDPSKRNSDRPRSRAWIWLAVVIVLAALVIGYFRLGDSLEPAMKVETAIATAISTEDAAADLVATGYVVAQRKAEVASKGTGRLVFLGFEEGDRVKQGEVIARLDNADIKAALDLAKANREKAMVDTLDAGRNYRRARNLFKSGAVTDVDLEQAETRYKSSLAALMAAQASVRTAEVDLENTYIRAPFDGTILTKNADVGEMVAPFASASTSKGSVVTLADMSSLEVEADVSESNIQKVSIGQPCEIILDAYPDERYPGYVKKIVPTADRARATVLTKVAFRSLDDRVLPEMSARINFLAKSGTEQQQQSGQGVTIPKSALTTRDDLQTVFRIDGKSATAITVTVGRELADMVEITSGLKPGDRVVLSPPGKMTSGQKVEFVTD